MVNEQTTNSDGTCTLTDVSGEITITVTKERYQDTETTLTVTEDTTVTIELEEVDDMDIDHRDGDGAHRVATRAGHVHGEHDQDAQRAVCRVGEDG